MNVNTQTRKAQQKIRQEKYVEAISLLATVLDRYPENVSARNTLRSCASALAEDASRSVATVARLLEAGFLDEAALLASELLQLDGSDHRLWNSLGVAQHRQGRIAAAKDSFLRALDLHPGYAEANNSLGVILGGEKRENEAAEYFRKAVSSNPEYAEAYCNLGAMQRVIGKLDDAETALERAITIRPDYAEAYTQLGSVRRDRGDVESAAPLYREALRLNPDLAAPRRNLDALAVVDEPVGLDENERDVSSDAESSESGVAAGADAIARGDALARNRHWSAALAEFERAVELDPDNERLLLKLGELHIKLRHFEKAVGVLDAALELNPGSVDVANSLGVAYFELGDMDASLTALRIVLEKDSRNALVYRNIGQIMRKKNRLDDALRFYRTACEIDPADDYAQMLLLTLKRSMCDWTEEPAFVRTPDRLGVGTIAVDPWEMLKLEDNPERQLQRARLFSSTLQVDSSLRRPPIAAAEEARRIRIGYFSADFHDFAGMYLLIRTLELHDREKFEIYAFSHGPDSDSTMRDRIVRAVDHFVDIRDLSDAEAAETVRDIGIDIAINRNGYTLNHRSTLFQSRIAPVQILYLGYPGTMGTEFMDYLVADSVVIPDEQRCNYAEKIIYMPHCYQPNDDSRERPRDAREREAYGLAPDAFVFCCFNNSYKLTLAEFAIWMRLLKRVPDSVLWVLKKNAWVAKNLRDQASAHGVDPARIVFAEPAGHAEHMARHVHADLFLDTFIVGAHTTASDALWAGLPVITRIGKQFAARVSASILCALGMEELVVTDEVSYETLAYELATDADRLRRIREKLTRNIGTAPLFDSERYTRNFEAGLGEAFARAVRGEGPADLHIVAPV